jgi:orotidine-5'-phosphate decarboxylase
MSTRRQSPIILALDTDDLEIAGQWILATRASVDIYKVGLEFFLKFGSTGLKRLYEFGDFELFLDLKLHDIPNTVAGGVHAVKDLSPRFLTVHASGGADMVAAACAAAPDVAITAVTVLTSISAQSLTEMGINSTPLDFAAALAKNSVGAGARAIVSSPLEVAAIKAVIGNSAAIITPGVRPLGADVGDQSRVMTPQDAMAAGSDFLVIGRPITSLYQQSAQAMADKASEILASIS